MARTLVEVFHNVPPGKRCSATIASARANAEGSDVELRVFPFPSEQATRRGVLSAPTLVVVAPSTPAPNTPTVMPPSAPSLA